MCCETRSCHARRHNDLEGHSHFSSAIYNFSILCLEHVEINSGAYLLQSYLFTSGGLGLGLVTLVLVL